MSWPVDSPTNIDPGRYCYNTKPRSHESDVVRRESYTMIPEMTNRSEPGVQLIVCDYSGVDLSSGMALTVNAAIEVSVASLM